MLGMVKLTVRTYEDSRRVNLNMHNGKVDWPLTVKGTPLASTLVASTASSMS